MARSRIVATSCARRPRRRATQSRRAPDVIYQATFFDGTWRGHADFLLRVESPDRPSRFGPYHYEVADTKLARHVKASAVLQICTYVELLTGIQGIEPEWMHVALGGSARAVERLRVDDYMAYYRAAKARFLAALADPTTLAFPSATTYPEPVDHCDVCRWAIECRKRRRDDDHLSLVAGISARQRRALADRGITTLEDLGRLPLPVTPKIEGTSEQALVRVREQARIQLEGRLANAPRHELLLPAPGEAIDPERGLATLPEPSKGDLFFDIEGDPFAFEDGLTISSASSRPTARSAFWSRDETGAFSLDAERAAFERFIDFVMERLERDPALHVYHYAPYEPTALKRLMGRYGTREIEVDRLLRGGVLVDLLRAVRQGVRASVESYSIKKMEQFYFERDIDLRDAGSSIVAFEQWLELGEGERPASDHPRADRALQRGRRRQQRPLARLAGDAPRRARSGNRARGPATDTRDGEAPEELVRGPGPCRGARRPARRRRPERACRTDGRGARPLAAGSVARLAPPRGQVDVVGVPPPHGPHAGAARRRIGAARAARAGETARSAGERQAGLALPIPAAGLRPGPWRCLRPGAQGA